MNIPHDHVIANGPEGLTQVLDDLFEKSKCDPTFVKKDYYVLYQLGNQKSLILVDTTKQPFRFWHYDFMGRPATIVVKEAIEKFLWEKCGERERVLKELNERH